MSLSRRHVRSVALPALAALILAGGLAGCGEAASSSGSATGSGTSAQELVSSGPLSGKTAQQVYAAAMAASTAAPGLHMSGSLRQGQTIGLDLSVVSTRAAGTFVLNGASIKVVKVGSTVYAKPSKAFLAGQGAMGAVFARKIGSKWLKADASLAALTGLGDVTHFTSAADAVSAVMPKNATMTLVPGRTVDGQATTGVRFSLPSPARTGTLYVATSGTPYPLRLESAQLGTLTFTDWGHTAAIVVPAAKDVVDLNKLSLSGLG
jgi:hypothetical protein